MPQPGDRVGAILSGGQDGYEFLGYGVYVGDEVPQEAVGLMAEGLQELGIGNPKIKLDSGQVVYGCECWWGPEDQIKRTLEGKNVIDVSIDDVRERWQEEDAQDDTGE